LNADAGQNPGTPGDVTTRRVTINGGSQTLAYDLFVHGTTNEWGNATSGTQIPGTANPTAVTYAIDGSLPGTTPVAGGVYQDYVTVTVTN
ncbi:MAG: spore coat protein U domain-containing protein, partial [Rhodomicrobium sp.]